MVGLPTARPRSVKVRRKCCCSSFGFREQIRTPRIVRQAVTGKWFMPSLRSPLTHAIHYKSAQPFNIRRSERTVLFQRRTGRCQSETLGAPKDEFSLVLPIFNT